MTPENPNAQKINMTATATSIDLIKNLYAAFGQGDVPFILAHIAPECQ